MQNSRVSVVLTLCLQLFGILTCIYCVKQPCPYSAENIDQAYQHCAALSHTSSFSLVLKSGHFPRLEPELTNAFLGYCSHVQEINSCVLGLLTSRDCDQALSELYLSLATKSSSLCSANGSLGDDLNECLEAPSSVNLEDIDRCKPSSFDFTLCKRLADETRNTDNRNTMEDIGNQETDYLLEVSLCIYSSVFVGCPSDTAILTLLYTIEDWIPPRLGANARDILRILRNRDLIFT